MKTLLLTLVVSFAAHATPPAENLLCEVISISGSMGSFVPPRVGDQIDIDSTRLDVVRMNFSHNKSIPVTVPLLRSKSTPDHIVSFLREQHPGGKLILMVGRFFDGTKSVHQGEIQYVMTDPDTALVSVESVKLDCIPR